MLEVQLLSEGWGYSPIGLQTKIKPQMVPQEPAKIISPVKMLINTEKYFKNPLI